MLPSTWAYMCSHWLCSYWDRNPRRLQAEPSVVAFDVNRNRCDALYVGLYVQSRVVLLPGLWALDVY